MGIQCTGVDANPVAVFASRVKTNWNLNPTALLDAAYRVARLYNRKLRGNFKPHDDPCYKYIHNSGMLKRKWISRANLTRAILLKQSIASVEISTGYRDACLLALLSAVVDNLSNVRFGPELYCSTPRPPAKASRLWLQRVRTIANDLTVLPRSGVRANVLAGDSRRIAEVLRRSGIPQADAVISSPPYPAEHDYTRNTRLELAFMESVVDRLSLRAVKGRMLRSHTKNIYIRDQDRRFVKQIKEIAETAQAIAERVKDNEDGFARYYESVILEYFGGMSRHFRSLRNVLRAGAKCAYVVGEQASYARVPVRTADLLALVAESAGFRVEAIESWRNRKSSTTSIPIPESILFLSYKGVHSRTVP